MSDDRRALVQASLNYRDIVVDSDVGHLYIRVLLEHTLAEIPHQIRVARS